MYAMGSLALIDSKALRRMMQASQTPQAMMASPRIVGW
jgi:hypothetical protein